MCFSCVDYIVCERGCTESVQNIAAPNVVACNHHSMMIRPLVGREAKPTKSSNDRYHYNQIIKLCYVTSICLSRLDKVALGGGGKELELHKEVNLFGSNHSSFYSLCVTLQIDC